MNKYYLNIALCLTLGVLGFMFYKNYNQSVTICNGTLETSKKYVSFLKDNQKLDSLCYYSDKILNNEFSYLQIIIDNESQIGKEFFVDKAKIISQLITKSNHQKFKIYFNNTSKENRWKIIFLLKSTNNNDLILNEIEEINQDYRMN